MLRMQVGLVLDASWCSGRCGAVVGNHMTSSDQLRVVSAQWRTCRRAGSVLLRGRVRRWRAALPQPHGQVKFFARQLLLSFITKYVSTTSSPHFFSRTSKIDLQLRSEKRRKFLFSNTRASENRKCRKRSRNWASTTSAWNAARSAESQ